MRYRDVEQAIFWGEPCSTVAMVPTCSLRPRTRRAAFWWWPLAILDLRCARWPAEGQVGTTGCRLSIEQQDDVRPQPARGTKGLRSRMTAKTAPSSSRRAAPG